MACGMWPTTKTISHMLSVRAKLTLNDMSMALSKNYRTRSNRSITASMKPKRILRLIAEKRRINLWRNTVICRKLINLSKPKAKSMNCKISSSITSKRSWVIKNRWGLWVKKLRRWKVIISLCSLRSVVLKKFGKTRKITLLAKL